MDESRLKTVKSGWKTAVLITAVFVAATAPAIRAEVIQRLNNPLAAIETDYKAGKVTLDEKVLLQIKAISDPAGLPAQYRVSDADSGVRGYRGATMALREIVLDWDKLAPSTQLAFSQAMIRQTTAYEYDSPGGFFKLHYDLTGDAAVPAADDDLSGIPDFVEKCAAYCDTSYDEHQRLGYFAPPGDAGQGGDNKYDIYFDDFDYYGMTVPEAPGPEPWDDYVSYIVLHHSFQGFPPNDDPEGEWQGAAKATAAHEFHHATQWTYDIGEGSWYEELDAVHMEDIIYPHVNDNYNYMADFFYAPEKSLMENSFHYYSCFVWGMYLTQRFDTSLMVSVWEGARYSPTVYDALSDTLAGRYGWTQDSAFAEFTSWNYVTGGRDDGLHYDDGDDYMQISIGRSHSFFPVPVQNSPKSPAGYGSCYVQFIPGTATGMWRFVFDGADSRQWSAYLIKSTSVDAHEFVKIELDPMTYQGSVVVEDIGAYYRLTLVGANLSEFSSGANFSYAVEYVPIYSVEVAPASDTALYSGGSRPFEFVVTNTSTDNDIFDISFSDNLGWVTPDAISKSLLAGQDTTITVEATAPLTTPLGTTCELYVSARSWGESAVFDSISRVAEVVLQNGDANFSGKINVSDVTYLTTFLFGGGPEPIPVFLAGDFNCSSTVNISDIARMIDYLFGDGTPPPCNPY